MSDQIEAARAAADEAAGKLDRERRRERDQQMRLAALELAASVQTNPPPRSTPSTGTPSDVVLGLAKKFAAFILGENS